jgi:DNA-binding LacI/PurR family transcriptional regulator
LLPYLLFRQPIDEIGDTAAKLMLKRVKNRFSENHYVTKRLKTKLVEYKK